MRSTKARVSALLLAVTAGFAFANDDAAKAKEAVAQTKAAIDAELSKPLSKPLAPTVVQEASRMAGAEAPTGSNRFVERPNTGDSKLVRTAPPVVLPKGPLGKPPIDPLKAIAEGQREGGVGLDAVQREINLPGLKKDDLRRWNGMSNPTGKTDRGLSLPVVNVMKTMTTPVPQPPSTTHRLVPSKLGPGPTRRLRSVRTHRLQR